MKILQIHNYHYPRGGAEVVYLETSALLQKYGHDVVHFSVLDPVAVDSPYKEYFVKPADYLDCSIPRKAISFLRFLYSGEAKQKLERLLQNEKPDLAHLHIFYGRLTSSILPVLKKYGVPVVMSVHDYKMLCPVYTLLNGSGEICEKCVSGNYFHCIEGRCNRNNLLYSGVSALECWVRDHLFPYDRFVDKFVMVSKFVMDKHLQYRPALRMKVSQISNFVDLDRFTAHTRPGDYYLYLGRLSKEKGIITLLNAWKEFPRLTLKITGAGPLQDSMTAFIKTNGLCFVEPVGKVGGQTLIDLIRNAKFVIIPSEWYEVGSLSVSESLACGKPVLAARIGGIPEAIRDGFNGFLFESRNVHSLVQAIAKAESVPENEYPAMSRNARQSAETLFSTDRYYAQLMKVYTELIER